MEINRNRSSHHLSITTYNVYMFLNLAELPVSHLLHHVIPRSYTFPVDPMVQSATDETAVQLSELLSLPVLMKRSITAPLVSQ